MTWTLSGRWTQIDAEQEVFQVASIQPCLSSPPSNCLTTQTRSFMTRFLTCHGAEQASNKEVSARVQSTNRARVRSQSRIVKRFHTQRCVVSVDTLGHQPRLHRYHQKSKIAGAQHCKPQTVSWVTSRTRWSAKARWSKRTDHWVQIDCWLSGANPDSRSPSSFWDYNDRTAVNQLAVCRRHFFSVSLKLVDQRPDSARVLSVGGYRVHSIRMCCGAQQRGSARAHACMHMHAYMHASDWSCAGQASAA